MKNPFQSLVEDLEVTGSMLSREDVERDFARNARQERMDRTRPPITAADIKSIVNGTLEERTALKTVRRWLAMATGQVPNTTGKPLCFLALLGPKSLGKTVAAIWAVAEVGGAYVTAGDLRRMTSSYDARDRELLKDLYRTRLVVLDDVGTEALTDTAEEAVFDFINARQVENALTIITGNITTEQFKERYQERVYERVTHQGFFVELNGSSLRRT
jgi:hypothetical protein